MDTIPRKIFNTFEEFIPNWLPGWSIDGIYNFQAGASTQIASAQLEVLMQNGSHPWINNRLIDLLEGEEFQALDPAGKTKYFAALHIQRV